MAHYTITIEETGESYRCSDQETLLVGMEKLGQAGHPGWLPGRRLRRLQGRGRQRQLTPSGA